MTHPHDCDRKKLLCPARENLLAEIERLRVALTMARLHVLATNQAEHMMDGFGPHRAQPSDTLLAEIDGVLGNLEQQVSENG